MNPTDDDIQKAKDKLNEYADTIESGDTLDPEADALELDVGGGRIWLHPDNDGTTVDIHLFDDTEDRDFSPARSRLLNHLTRGVGLPTHGRAEPHTPFIGSERMNIRADFEYL